jgi:SAM-dependent methyltransferase
LEDRSRIGQRFTGRHAFLCKVSGDLTGEVMLDVGCGFGWFEEWAIEHGCASIVGLDLDPYLVERATAAAPEAEILLRDVKEPLSDLGLFSVVSAFDFVEHLAPGEQVKVLQDLKGVLEPDGRLLLSVPYKSVLSNALDPAWYFRHRHFSVQEMESLLDRAGFRSTRMAFGGGMWEQISLTWLYIFKWVFAREMPFADFLEKKRFHEYSDFKTSPGRGAFATMFVEARQKK